MATATKTPAVKKATPPAKAAPVKKAAAAKPAAAKKATPPATKAAPVKKAAPAPKPAAPAKSPAAAPTAEVPADEMGSDLLSMSQVWLTHAEIVPDGQNLRQQLTEIDELADSIASVGLLEPLHVTLSSRPEDLIAGNTWYWIVAGHRRHAAIGKLIADGRWPATRRIACVLGPDPALSEEARTVAQLIENLQRVDLNPIEEATGYNRLVEAGWKQTRIADTIGRHQNRVSERMQLLKLPDVWQAQVADGSMTLGIAAKLAAITPGARTILLTATGPLSAWEIDNAVARDRKDVAVATTKSNATARDIQFLGKQSWEMDGYVKVLDTTPDGLAKVLLPEPVTPLWAVTIETHATPKVTVWRPQAAGNVDVDGEKTPAQLWNDECARIRKEHYAAVKAFNERRDEATTEWAKSVETKAVAAAAMQMLLKQSNQRERLAKQLGWTLPRGLPAEEAAQHLAEWYSHAANLSAALALYMSSAYYAPDSFKELAETHLVAAGLAKSDTPKSPTFPPEPGVNYCSCGECAELDQVDRCHVDEPGQTCDEECCTGIEEGALVTEGNGD